MYYDKGQQITVGRLKEYLALIPNDVNVFVGMGSDVEPLHYLLRHGDGLLLHPDAYMIDAEESNINTIMSFNTKQL